MKRGTVICVAESWAAAAYLRALAEGWLGQSPDFEWCLLPTDRVCAAFSEMPVGTHTVNGDGDFSSRLAQACDRPGPKVLLVSASGSKTEFAVVDGARSSGLPVLQYIDTWYNYRRRLQADDRLVLGDRILVIDDCAAAEAADEGLPRSLLVAVGHPVWQRCQPLPPSPTRSLLFVGAPVQREYGMTLGYTERHAWSILKSALDAFPGLFDDISYAPHPDDADALRIDGVKVVRYRPEMLSSVDTVVGMFSAPLIDAFLARRRAVTLQPNATSYDMCPLSRHGRIPRTTTVDGLMAALRATPPSPALLAHSLTGSQRRITAEIEKALPA